MKKSSDKTKALSPLLKKLTAKKKTRRKPRSEKSTRRCRLVLGILALLLVIAVSVPLILNATVVRTTRGQIPETVPEGRYEYALILGAKVHKGGRLSDMLRDRMDVGISLYHDGAVKKLLVSGDGSGEWSETEAMKQYAVQNGVFEEDILTDPEGFSTYESLFRAKTVYHADSLVVVTQKYHLYRALYIANDLELDACGADAALYAYAGQLYREIREVLARVKDLIQCMTN